MNKRLAKKLFDASAGTLRSILYSFLSLFPSGMPLPDKNALIDVAIPLVPKDLPTLPLCVTAVRTFIPHKIKNIYLIAPKTPETIDAANNLGLTFLDENSILPGAPHDIPIENPDRQNRKGWIFQQFIKLSANVGTAPDILFIDADHILLKPHTFISQRGKRIFYVSAESYFPYYDNIRRITGRFPIHPFSFIAHKMLFNRENLLRLQEAIITSPFAKKLNNTSSKKQIITDWKQIILRSLDWDYSSPFSEFELYPNIIPSEQRSIILWKQVPLKIIPDQLIPASELKHSDDGINQTLLDILHSLSKKYPRALSVTFPAYLRK